MKRKKVIVLAIDGGTFKLFDPLFAKGSLPNIQRMVHDGAHGLLKSIVHPLSPQAWATIITGLNPGKHGVFDFRLRKDSSYEMGMTNASCRKGTPIWTLLSEHGKKVGICNIPFTYPPDKVNGFIVSGMDTLLMNNSFTYPQNLSDDIRSLVGKYMIDFEEPYYDEDSYFKAVHLMLDKRLEVMECLLTRYKELDLFFGVFMAFDKIYHPFWKYLDPDMREFNSPKAEYCRKQADECLEKIDRFIGDLLDRVKDSTIILMSDHGFGPLYKEFFMNYWLKEVGLLKLKNSYNTNSSESFLHHIDWKQTRAYSCGYFGNIYFNLKGREPDGIVQSGQELDELIISVRNQLEQFVDPEDEKPLVDAIYDKRDLYHGKYLPFAPELLIVMRNYSYMVRDGFERNLDRLIDNPAPYHKGQFPSSGNHYMDGFLIMYGENIRRGAKIFNAGIIDFAPTLLDLMDIPVPSVMDGKVLKDAFNSCVALAP